MSICALRNLTHTPEGAEVELLPYLALGLVAVAGAVATHLYRRRKEEALGRLLARDRSLQLTASPLGWDRHRLQATCATLPQGDRRYGLEFGVEGPLATTVAGERTQLPCAAFRWWWEERSRGQQHGQRHQLRRTTVCLTRLPAGVAAPVVIRPESALGRLGVARRGRQLESSEFNRRFRVECADDRFAMLLLDADLQATLLEGFTGRSIELVGDLLVVAGTPDHRDGSLTGVVGELPAVRQDLARLVAALPDQLWRHLRPETAHPAVSRPTSGHPLRRTELRSGQRGDPRG